MPRTFLPSQDRSFACGRDQKAASPLPKNVAPRQEMLRSRLVFATLPALAMLAPSPARGAAYYISDVGPRGLARAGAYVAAPDSLLAIHYNPAGLSLLSGAHFEVDLTPVFLNFEFQRSCPCVDASHPRAAMFDAALEQQFAGNPSKTNSPYFIPF